MVVDLPAAEGAAAAATARVSHRRERPQRRRGRMQGKNRSVAQAPPGGQRAWLARARAAEGGAGGGRRRTPAGAAGRAPEAPAGARRRSPGARAEAEGVWRLVAHRSRRDRRSRWTCAPSRPPWCSSGLLTAHRERAAPRRVSTGARRRTCTQHTDHTGIPRASAAPAAAQASRRNSRPAAAAASSRPPPRAPRCAARAADAAAAARACRAGRALPTWSSVECQCRRGQM